MRFISISCLFFVSSIALADDSSCTWGTETIAAGASVYVRDPNLFESNVNFLVENGMSLSEAKIESEQSDWVGYVVECRRTFKPGTLSTPSGRVIEPTGYAMVLADHQEGLFQSQGSD